MGRGKVCGTIKIYWGVLCRDRGERCGAAINKQRRKADAEQTSPENNNNDLLQAYLYRQAPGHTHTRTHRHRKPDEEGVYIQELGTVKEELESRRGGVQSARME